MDNRVYLIDLYDYYMELLTEKQKEYFEDYYFNNLSLSEISSNYDISRNAIHKQIKDVIDKLNYYESKLHLYDKKNKINRLIENIDNELKEQIKELI